MKLKTIVEQIMGEGALNQSVEFEQDVRVLIEKFEEMFKSREVEEMFKNAHNMGGEVLDIYGGMSHDEKIKLNLDHNFNVQIKIKSSPGKNDSVAHYDPNSDAIVFTFYLGGWNTGFEVGDDFVPHAFYKKNKQWMDSTIAHELSHAYKARHHMSTKHSKSFVKPKDVASGKKNVADYAKHRDEKESYLAAIWKEMRDIKSENANASFYECLNNSPVFRRTLSAMGGEGHVNEKYKKLYKYFLKKLLETWKKNGFKIEKSDVTQAAELC